MIDCFPISYLFEHTLGPIFAFPLKTNQILAKKFGLTYIEAKEEGRAREEERACIHSNTLI